MEAEKKIIDRQPEGSGAAATQGQAPRTLQLALEQLHEALEKCGAEACENFIKGEGESGYAQFVAALEKLSKCSWT